MANNKDLVTKQYVNILVKNLYDILIDHINNKDSAHSIDDESSSDINYVIETLDNNVIPLEEIKSRNSQVSIEDIALDANHKFITENQLLEFSNKASKEEIMEELSNYKSDIKKELNEKFEQLLNNKDALEKIKIISRTLNDENESLDELLSSIIYAIKELLDEHINDGMHLSSDDRAAINKLLKFINIGCADWNAKETDPNYIRNKPEAFKADGGNADTLGNCELEDIRNRQLERIIIGHDDRATHKLSSTSLNNEYLNDIYSIDNGIIGFTEGAFMINGVFSPKAKDIGELIFRGSGKGTVLNINSFNTSDNITLENITLYDSNIVINSKTIFRNVNFVNCKITFSDNSRLFKIIDCDFDKCNLHFNGAVFNSVIKDNIFKYTDFKFVGDSNIIKNNIFC